MLALMNVGFMALKNTTGAILYPAGVTALLSKTRPTKAKIVGQIMNVDIMAIRIAAATQQTTMTMTTVDLWVLKFVKEHPLS